MEPSLHQLPGGRPGGELNPSKRRVAGDVRAVTDTSIVPGEGLGRWHGANTGSDWEDPLGAGARCGCVCGAKAHMTELAALRTLNSVGSTSGSPETRPSSGRGEPACRRNSAMDGRRWPGTGEW